VAGVGVQLQAASLHSLAVYVVAAAVGVASAVVCNQRVRGAPNSVVWAGLIMVALALSAWGFTGVRAVVHDRDRLDPAWEGRDVAVQARVLGLPVRSAQSMRLVLALESTPAGVRLPSRVQVHWYAHGAQAWPEVRSGERWALTLRLRQVHGASNPHGFDRELWLWQQGVGALGYVRSGPQDPVPMRVSAASPWSVDAARHAVVRAIEQRLGDTPAAGVIRALVVGEQAAIEREDAAIFRTTGVAHLMSISGLHVTMFAWLAMLVLRWVWRRWAGVWPSVLLAWPTPTVAAWGGVALATAYAVFSGWAVPAQRTVLMLAVVVALRWGVRRWPWPVVWACAMLAVVCWDPWALLQAGFWLSFVAVAILMGSDAPSTQAQRPSRWRERSWAWWRQLLREQSLITVALVPMTLVWFGQVSWVSMLANLLAIPWVTLLVTPLAMLGVLVPPLWDWAAAAVGAMLVVLGAMAQWPWAASTWAAPPWPLAVLSVLGGAVAVMPWPWVVRGVGLLAVAPVLWFSPARPAMGEFEVVALDVGQGSAVVVRTAGHTLLYDTGPRYGPEADAGQWVVLPYVWAMGERLDAVIVSHADSDHAGGAASVAQAFPQARWLSSYDELAERRCQAGQHWQWDGVRFELVHPSPEDYGPDGRGRMSTNAMSCVLLVGDERRRVWLGGDIDAERETRWALQNPHVRVEVMLAPHHGSATSSSPVLLNTLQPSWVMVQAGYRNRFGHPAPVVTSRYDERGIAWVASPECGAATWRSAQPDRLDCHRLIRPRYWQLRPRRNTPHERVD
jgi:competence protein ComEC